jgi:hypothetical protein
MPPAWCEAHSLTDVTARQEWQDARIREAVDCRVWRTRLRAHRDRREWWIHWYSWVRALRILRPATAPRRESGDVGRHVGVESVESLGVGSLGDQAGFFLITGSGGGVNAGEPRLRFGAVACSERTALRDLLSGFFGGN